MLYSKSSGVQYSYMFFLFLIFFLLSGTLFSNVGHWETEPDCLTSPGSIFRILYALPRRRQPSSSTTTTSHLPHRFPALIIQFLSRGPVYTHVRILNVHLYYCENTWDRRVLKQGRDNKYEIKNVLGPFAIFYFYPSRDALNSKKKNPFKLYIIPRVYDRAGVERLFYRYIIYLRTENQYFIDRENFV